MDRHGTGRRRASTALLALAALAVMPPLVTLPGVTTAQSLAAQARTGSGLHGVVVDAVSDAPLAGATVSLEPIPAGFVSRDARGAGGLLSTGWRASTGEDGTYSFRELPSGSYRLHIVRIGYEPATLEVHYDGPADPRLSVGLEVQPIELAPVEVVARRRSGVTVGAGRAEPHPDGRIRLERLRQARHLTPDTRVVTDGDLVEAATVGETDLLRALHQLPGVAADDDWSAEPWTRGGRWDETRIFYDGLPLLNPTHLGGAFTAVSPDAVGTMTFHPGVHPLGGGSAASGIVDLRSRPAAGPERLSALGQLSLLSGRFSVERPFGDGSGVSLSGRRSYIEELTRGERETRPESYIPYRFSDLAGRWDQVVDDSLKLEVSGITTRDRVLGDLPHELKGARGEWGNTVLRASLESTSGGLRGRFTYGRARYASEVDLAPFDAGRPDLVEAKTAAPTWNQVRTGLTEFTLEPLGRGGAAPPWHLGARWVATDVEYRGPAPWPYPDGAVAGELDQTSRVSRVALWGGVRTELGSSIAVAAGLQLVSRALFSSPLHDTRLAPRASLAWRATPSLRLSAAVGRHHQWEQALAASGFSVGPALVPGHLWVSARGDIPPLRADLFTIGAELWVGSDWLVSANAYHRRTTGHLTPAPDSGYVRARPAVVRATVGDGWVSGDGAAVGLELGARKLAGRWTGSVSYSLARARLRTDGVRYPAPGDRRHVLDAAALFRMSPRTSLGATLTAASGAPFTRFYAFRCPEVTWYCPEVGTGPTPIIGWVEAPGAERMAPYASLDLHAERTGTILGLPYGVYVQVRNALARDNRAAYAGSVLACDDAGGACTLTDRFEDGMPLLPFVGFWIRL